MSETTSDVENTDSAIFTDDILPRIQANHYVLSVVTYEWQRIQDELLDAGDELERRVFRWTSASPHVLEFSPDTVNLDNEGSWEPIVETSFDDFTTQNETGRFAVDAVIDWYKRTQDTKNSILWLEDITPYLQMESHGANSDSRRLLVRRIRDFCMPCDNVIGKTIVMSFPDAYLPMELEKDVEQFTIPLPKFDLLNDVLDIVLDDINETRTNNEIIVPKNLRGKLVKAALGLTWQEAEGGYRAIIARMDLEEPPRTKMKMSDINVLIEQKAQIIEKTGVLQFIPFREKMSDIGGMKNLKEWLDVYKGALDDKKDPPKGILMMGVPGCGKSVMSRAIAQEWNLPLLSMNAANIFDKYVGESEGKIGRALAIAEAMAPCVLWIDEIEKLLAGSGGGSEDGGVSARVGGALLGWMADKQEPVFVVATANHPDRMDAEYLRRGRFDERFFVDLPGVEVRKTIIQIHLEKRFAGISEKLNIEKLSSLTNGYTGAEIEACIVDSKNRARHQEMEEPTEELLSQVISEMVPDVIANGARIQRIRDQWGGNRAKRVDEEEEVDVNSDDFNNEDVRTAIEEAEERKTGIPARRRRKK